MKNYEDDENGFRFNSQKVFLTYPQTPQTFDQERLLMEISQKADVQDYLISKEIHEDGGNHLHAYFKFQKKLDTRNVRYFDVEYYNKIHHPNIQKPKTTYKLYAYIKKEGNFITNMTETRPLGQILLEEDVSLEDACKIIYLDIGTHKSYIGWNAWLKAMTLKHKREGDSKTRDYIQKLENEIRRLRKEKQSVNNTLRFTTRRFN